MNSILYTVADLQFHSEQDVLSHLATLSANPPVASAPIFYSRADFTTMFWGSKQGEAFTGKAYGKPFATIDQTEVLSFVQSFIQENDLPIDFRKLLNREASRLYAESVSGDVYAFVFESTNRPFVSWKKSGESEETEQSKTEKRRRVDRDASLPRAFDFSADDLTLLSNQRQLLQDANQWQPHNSIWFDIELPTLLNNPKVNSINRIPKAILKEHWEKNQYSTDSLIRISKDIADGIFRMAPPILEGPPAKDTSSQKGMSGATPLTPEASKTFARRLQKPSNFTVQTEPLSRSQELFRTHGTLPGGVVFAKEIDSSFEVYDLRIDPKKEGTFIVNGNLHFNTGLTYEEIALVLESFRYAKPLGATSVYYSSASKSEGALGTILRLADKAFGDYVYRGIPITGFSQAVSTKFVGFGTDLKLLEELDAEYIGQSLEQFFTEQNATIIAEFKKIGFAVKGTALKIDDVHIGLHACIFSGTVNQPKLSSGYEDFALRYPVAAQRLESLQEGLSLHKSEIFQKLSEYAAVCALVNQFVQSKSVEPAHQELVKFVEINKALLGLSDLTERTIYEDSPVFKQNQLTISQNKKSFFALLDKLKVEEDPNRFALQVGAAYVCAMQSGIKYLTHSLSFEVRRRICHLVPTISDNPRLQQLQKLCAWLASVDLLDPFKPSMQVEDSMQIQSERAAILKAVNYEASGKYLEAIYCIGKAVEFLEVKRQLEEQEYFGQLSMLISSLCNRGYGVQLATHLANSITKVCRDVPALTTFINWEYAAALGFVISDLRSKCIPLDFLVSSVKNQLNDKRDAAEATQLILGVYAELAGEEDPQKEEAFIASSLCMLHRGATRAMLSTQHILVSRAVTLYPVFHLRPFLKIETTRPMEWNSSGLIGIDRLQIESEHVGIPSQLDKEYRAIVKSLVDKIKAEKISLDAIPQIITSLAATLYGPTFSYSVGDVNLLAHALTEKKLDCDTSVFIFTDVLSQLGITVELVHTPGHLLLRVEDCFVETAQGLILSKESLRKQYGGVIHVGDSVLFAASVSYMSVAEHLVDLTDKETVLQKAKQFTPKLGHLLCNLVSVKCAIIKDNESYNINNPSEELLSLLEDVESAKKADSFSTLLMIARHKLANILPEQYRQDDPLFDEFFPFSSYDTAYKSERIINEEDDRELEKQAVIHLALFKMRLLDNLNQAYKDFDNTMLSSGARVIQKIHFHSDDLQSKSFMDIQKDLMRFNPGNNVLLHADLAANYMQRSGSLIDPVSLYSIALWENPLGSLALARRVKAKDKRKDLIGGLNDYKQLIKQFPEDHEYAYGLAVRLGVTGNYDEALHYLDQARTSYDPDFINRQIKAIKEAKASDTPLHATVQVVKNLIAQQYLDSAINLIAFIEDKYPRHPSLDQLKQELKSDQSISQKMINSLDTDEAHLPHKIQQIIARMKELGKNSPEEAGKFFSVICSQEIFDLEIKAKLLPFLGPIQRKLGNAHLVIKEAEKILKEKHSLQTMINLLYEAALSAVESSNVNKALEYISGYKDLSQTPLLPPSLRTYLQANTHYLYAIHAIKCLEIESGGKIDELMQMSFLLDEAPSASRVQKIVQTVYARQPGVPRLIQDLYGDL